ncbi:MAG: fluoride efflux transporter CrcB [Pseudomonadota bacterium]|nr:fluoride efflux transporter CrcB [Pseudomonadota bacterium]
MAALLVFVGGGVGALLRYLAALAISGPLATLAVNVAGSLVIGLLAAAIPAEAGQMRLFLLTGLLGGFTTFSAFSLDALTLYQRGDVALAAAYVLASVFVSLAAAAAGLALAR